MPDRFTPSMAGIASLQVLNASSLAHLMRNRAMQLLQTGQMGQWAPILKNTFTKHRERNHQEYSRAIWLVGTPVRTSARSHEILTLVSLGQPEMPVGQTGREGDAEHEQEPTTQDGPRAPVAEPPNWDDEVDESIGPKVTRVYELPKAFLSEVEEHSKRYYPGTKLKMSLKEKSVTINCRNDHTGCRYEFHAAWFVDTDGVRKLKITDVSGRCARCIHVM